VVRSSVVIVGAGISGLAAAWELSGAVAGPSEHTPRIEVIDSAPRVGGALATTTLAGRVIDLGADGFLSRRPEAVGLIRELGLEDQLEAIDASGAWIYLHGVLYELPSGLVLGVPTNARDLKNLKGLSRAARWHLRRDQWLPRRLTVGEDASIGEIVRTKLGDELSYQFIEPMIGGIQAGRIDELSARSVFPALLDAARKGGSLTKALRPIGPVSPGPTSTSVSAAPLFSTLLDGVGSLPSELERRLKQRGVIVRVGVGVSALRRTPSGTYPWEVDTPTTTTPANVVIMSAPANVTGRLLGAQSSALRALEDVEFASASMVTFCLRSEDVALPVRGTGILVPLKTPWSHDDTMMVTAITLLDRKWPHLRRDGEVLLRAHVGRIDDDRANDVDDDELTERVASELRVILGHFGPAHASLVQRWPSALAQYHVGHEQLVGRARDAARELRVALAGMAYDGVGIPASIESGRRAARDVLAMLA
jgi:oxygen-dependent protoporphyrinogen oxidase